MANENKKEQQLRGQFEQVRKDAEGIFDDIPESFAKLSEKFKGDFQKIAEYIRKTRDELNELKSDFSGISKIYADTVKEYRKGNDALAQSLKSTNKLKDLANKLKYDKAGITTLGEKDLKRLVEQIQKERMELQIAIASKQIKGKALKDAQNTLYWSKLHLEGAIERLQVEKNITAQMGLAGNAVKAMSKALDKLGMGSLLKIEEITEKMREAAEQNRGKWAVLGVGIRASLVSIGEALRDPLMQITLVYKAFSSIVKLATEAQTKIFEMAKTMGVSVQHAQQLFFHFRDIAENNQKLAISAKQMSDSYTQMNATLGFMGPIYGDFATVSNLISRRTGATAQEMQDIMLFAKQTGSSFKDMYGYVIGNAKATAAQNKFMMTEKQIMEAISKTSATVYHNFKGNVKELAMAVMQATKLGITLDQVNQASFSMLDFESSISKEFEAQLLTGKQIDLSMARQYALTGDTEALMGEITRQLGNQNSWNRMNVLQQQSLAEAFGMTKEAVDEMYKKQTLINELGDLANSSTKTQYEYLVGQQKSHDEIARILGDEAATSIMAATMQEKMQLSMERFRDSLADLTLKMTPMLDFFVNMVTNTTTLKWLLGGVAVAMASIAAYSIYISREKNKQIAMQIRLLSTQVYLSSLAAQESLAKNKTAISSGTIASEDSARIAIQQALTGGAIVESAAKNSAANAPFTGGFGAVGIITSILAVLGSAAAMYGVYSALPTATAMPDVPSSVISPANPNIPESYGSNSGRMSGAPSVNVNLQNNIDPWTGKASVSYSSQYGAVPDNSIGQFRITN